MGYYHYRFAGKKLFQIIHNDALVVGIKGVGGFVEKQVIGVFVYCAGYEQPLLLPLADTAASRAYFGEQPERQLVYKVLYVGYFDGLLQLLLIGVIIAYGNVVLYRVAEDEPVLQYRTAGAAPGFKAYLVQVCSPHFQLALFRLVKAEQQL